MRDYSLTNAVPVVADAANDLPNPGIGLYVGVAGDVEVVTTRGDTITMVGLIAGIWHPISVKRIISSTATDMLVGW